MSRRALWPPTPPAGGPSTDECAPGDVHRHRAHDRAQAAPARAAAADRAADGIVAQAAPAAHTGAPVAPGAKLPPRSATLAEIDLHVRLARLADALAEAAGIVREIAEIQLAGHAERALMCDVEKPTTPARLISVRDVAQILSLSERTVRRLRQRGILPLGIEVAGVVRWRPEEIDAWIASGGKP